MVINMGKKVANKKYILIIRAEIIQGKQNTKFDGKFASPGVGHTYKIVYFFQDIFFFLVMYNEQFCLVT